MQYESVIGLEVHAQLPPQRFPSHSARVAPGGPTLRRLSSPRVAVLGRPSPWPCALRRGRCAALGTREEPWGGAVGGACSPAGGAGGVLPGWWRKNTVCFSYSLPREYLVYMFYVGEKQGQASEVRDR